ncbi:helix-turn-helix domain-containing protein [Promicromonospora sukumoe]|uniref:helix-turn-helix domain-containing protein n=1 Tax=Promicromonospora sukumoe TaxID=88382 RepID=UPI003669CC24
MLDPAGRMDETTMRHPDDGSAPELGEGFPGQRMRVLPQPLVTHARTQPATSQLLVTDAGFFPRASRHSTTRPHGAPQDIVMICGAGKGTCSMLSGVHQEVHQVEAGDALIIPAGTPHRYQADRSDPWTIWWLHVTGPATGGLFEAMDATPRQPVVRLRDPSRVVALVDTVLRRMERDETASSLVAAAGAAWHALALIAADRSTTAGDRAAPIETTLEFLRANIAERVSVPELATMAGLSQSHYAALFRRATGFGVLEYQTRLRMASARELLDTTDRTVGSIARQVGFADPLYFSRQFRKIHSLSPSEYRARKGR